MTTRPIVLALLVVVAVQAQNAEDLGRYDSTVTLADFSPQQVVHLAPDQPADGYSQEEIDQLIKKYLEQHQHVQQQLDQSGQNSNNKKPALEPVKFGPEVQPQVIKQQPVKQQQDGVSEVAEVLGAGILGGLIGSVGSEYGNHHHHGGYPYPANYGAGGYPSYPVGGAGYPYPSVYPTYGASAPYYPGSVYGNTYRPYGQQLKYFNSPAAYDYYYPYNRNTYATASPAAESGVSALSLRRPFNMLVNRKYINAITGGREHQFRGPLIGYLAKPESELARFRADGVVDRQMVEQSAINQGPFVYLYAEQDEKINSESQS